jgi:hypothetical protein
VVGVYLELSGHCQIPGIKGRVYAIVEFREIGDFNRSLNLRRILDRADGGGLN